MTMHTIFKNVRALVIIAIAIPALAWSAPPQRMALHAGPAQYRPTTTAVPPMYVVERDDARREIRVTFLADPAPGTEATAAPYQIGSPGKFIVRNFSSYYAEAYYSLDDDYTPFFSLGTVPPHYKLMAYLPRGSMYLFGADLVDGYDDGFEWGPTRFFMGKKHRFNLY